MVFLFSSFTGLPDSFFDGYCFCGADYIFGHEGMEAFFNATGKQVPIGEDGCYIIIKRSGDAHDVGVDYTGFKKIFYFHEGRTWCISNSIFDMANHLKQNGVNLSVNQPQLAALKINQAITQQISCFQTLFNEIKLLPSFYALRIKKDKLFFRRLPPEPFREYRNGFEYFLNIWVRRFETLLEDQRINMHLELSGGQDTRAVFSLFKKACDRVGCFKKNKRFRIRSNTDEYHKRDFEAAQKIVDYYGLKLNEKIRGKKNYYLGTDFSYYLWKSLNLGVYMPILFTNTYPHAFNVLINGAGGGRHRPVYPLEKPEIYASRIIRTVYPGFFSKSIRTVFPEPVFKKWKADFLKI